jgi:hypothetical protein
MGESEIAALRQEGIVAQSSTRAQTADAAQ